MSISPKEPKAVTSGNVAGTTVILRNGSTRFASRAERRELFLDGLIHG